MLLCALPVELKAVEAQMRAYGDVNSETVKGGEIRLISSFVGEHISWDLRAAVSEPRNAAAAAALASVMQSFNPDVAIFVGVAGGLPQRSVQLGDVIAATVVIDHEVGKDTPAGLQERPVHLDSSFPLRQAATHILNADQWQERIVPPALAIDGRPAAHIEPIAAGSTVVAGSATTTAQRIERVGPRAVAVEMEGAGFLEVIHRFEGCTGIVVRGISDLLDEKHESDHKGWQAQASANAAAFVFELLARLAPESP